MLIESSDSPEQETRRLQLYQIESSHPDWWFFPPEPRSKVQGFRGTGKIFIVGDQPSPARFEHNDKSRRLFYDLLADVNAGDCHLTDLYKRRGARGELEYAITQGIDPKKHPDFAEHLKVFLWEVNLLAPSTVLALGERAFKLLSKYTPELIERGIVLKQVWHFAVVGYGRDEDEKSQRRSEFGNRLRSAIRAAR